ncbi:MAG: polyisoprenoid-binding protein [Candidatus Omnitrophica bacterium]|nr:polyisoprenoid-binding protein [Candidatus Omnitrophota bacterium]
MRFRVSFIALLLLTFLSHVPCGLAANYNLDPDHTSINFKIRHLFSKVSGNFTQFEGKVEYDPDKPETWKTTATIQAASIDTRVPPRDKHLRSKDFFDVEKFPTLTFESTKVTDVADGRAKLHGNLTIHGVTKEVVFDLEIHGVGKDPWGNVRAGFTATAKINRKDFGLNWNEAVETGQLLVGEEVEITLEIEAIQE